MVLHKHSKKQQMKIRAQKKAAKKKASRGK